MAEVSTISTCSFKGKVTINPRWLFSNITSFQRCLKYASAWNFHTLSTIISIKSWRNVSCSITWKILSTQQTQKVFTKVCNKLTTKKAGLTGLNCFKVDYEAGHSNRVFGEAGQAVQNLRKINFLKFCDVIKNFQNSEMKFKVFC